MRLMFARALTVALAVLGGAAAMAFPKLIIAEAVPEAGPPLIAARMPDAMTVIHVAPAPAQERPATPRRVSTKLRPAAQTPVRSSVVSWTPPPAPSAPTAAPTPTKTVQRPTPSTPAPRPTPTPAPTPAPSPEPTPTPAPEAPTPAPAEEPVATPEPVRALVAVVVPVPVEEPVEPKKNKPSKPRQHERTPSNAADDNGPIGPVGFGVTPSAEQPPPAEDEQSDTDDQGLFGGAAEGKTPES